MRAVIAALATAAAVAGCQPAGFRAARAPIYSNAVLDTASLSGGWQEVAGFYDARAGRTCALGLARVEPAGEGMLRLTLSGCAGTAKTALARIEAPGRFRPALGGVTGQSWWVLWLDSGARTLVVGTPSGDFGAILDREGAAIPPDRMQAAREVLAFNGYDLTRLRPSQP